MRLMMTQALAMVFTQSITNRRVRRHINWASEWFEF